MKLQDGKVDNYQGVRNVYGAERCWMKLFYPLRLWKTMWRNAP